jgi:twitching motility two-component system response regulator PilH
MIVDDSPTETHVLKTMLEGNGFLTLMASDGRQAIDVCRKEKPDLVLMDVVMPGINGFQATRTLHRDPETSTIPIIMVTSKNQETDKEWARRQGASDYLVKPVREGDLIGKIRAALG